MIAVCLEFDFNPDVATVKRVLKKTIEIRREQVESITAGRQTEWTGQLTADFKTTLGARIGEFGNLGK